MKKLFIFGNVCKAHITTPPHQLKYLLTVICFSMWLSHASSQTVPNKLWATEIDNPVYQGGGRDWSMNIIVDDDNNLVGAGYTSELGIDYLQVVPAVYKVGQNGNKIWTTPITMSTCTTKNNYGQVNGIIQKKNQNGTFGNYVLITKEKACGGGGTDRTAVYEIDKNTGAVVNSNLNVFASQSWFTNAGVDILQKPDLSGYVIVGYFQTTSSTTTTDIYFSHIDNNFNLVSTATYGYTDGLDRPSKLEYVYSLGRFDKEIKSGGVVWGNGGRYNGDHDGYIFVGWSMNNTSGTYDVFVGRAGNTFYQTRIHSGDLTGSPHFYSKVYNTTSSCLPTPTTTGHDIADDIILLSDNDVCFNGVDYNNTVSFAIACVFNEYRSNCSGEYRDGDAAIIILTDVIDHRFGGCGTSYNIQSVKNVAHLSGNDFAFNVRRRANKLVGFASSKDNGIIPPSNSTTHFYMFENNMHSSAQNWSKVFHGNSGIGGCGFAFDLTKENSFVITGNDGNNHHDAVFARLSSTCESGTIYTHSITTPTTWSAQTLYIDGIIHVDIFGELTVDNSSELVFANECSGIELNSNLTLDNATLTKANEEDYIWKGIKSEGGGYITVFSSTVEHSNIAIDCHAKLSGLNIYSPSLYFFNATFRNNKTAVKKNGANWDPHHDQIWSSKFIINNDKTSKITNPARFVDYTNSDKLSFLSFFSIKNEFSNVTSIDVHAINKQGGSQLSVNNCLFNGIDKGIYIQGSNASDRIMNNTFTNIPGVQLFVPGYDILANYGIRLVGSGKVRIEGNSITGTSRATTAKIRGIMTDNSGSNGALMFKNNITITTTGFQSQNNNSNFAVSCNNFIDYAYYVGTGPAWHTASGSMLPQGFFDCAPSNSHTKKAGNEWTSLCTGSNVIDISVVSSAYFNYYGHFLDIQSAAKTRPECSTTAWESSYLHYCSPQDPGYQKQSTSCNSPFEICSGCRLGLNDLDIEPQLIYAKNYYRDHADNYRNQFAQNSKDKASKELLASYQGYEQLVSNEIIGILLERNVDTAIIYLESSDLLEDKKLLAELYLFTGNLPLCRKTLADISQPHSALKLPVHLHEKDEADYPDENGDFITLMQLVASIYESGRDMSSASDAEIAELERLSSSGLAVAAKACAYLKQATGKECQFEVLEYIPDAEEIQKRMSLPGFESEGIELLAYPNPANSNLKISVFIPEGFENPELSLYDLTGRRYEQIGLNHLLNKIELNTGTYPDGVYLLQVKTQNSVRTVRVSILR